MNKLLKIKNTWAYFNGSSSYIQYVDNDIFSFTDGVNDLPFEIEFDINITAVTSNTLILYKRDSTSTVEWQIWSSNNIIYFQCCSNGNYLVYIRIFSAALNFNTPYHIKCTYDGSKLWTGMKMYINNSLATVTNGSAGSYTGMINTASKFNIGYLGGYLRNIKIKKSDTLVFQTSLQDANAIGKDVINGITPSIISNVNVVDYNDGGNWLVTANGSSWAIGTAATLGYMNAGTFCMTFELVHISYNAATQRLFSTCASNAQTGFMFIQNTTTMSFMLCNASGVYLVNNTQGAISFGVPYKYTIRGNGTQIQIIRQLLSDGSILYDSGLLNLTYTPNGVNTSNLLRSSAFNVNYNLRNLNFYTDFAGTIPYLTLPMQNRDNIMLDTTGGLVGTCANVQIINNNTNVLKAQDKWMSFPNGGGSSYLLYADNDIFSMTDGVNDLPFSVEFDMCQTAREAGNNRIIWKSGFEWVIDTAASTNVLRIYCLNPAGNINILASSIVPVLNTPYHIKCTYDGSKSQNGLNIYINNVLQAVTRSMAGTYTGMTNTSGQFQIASNVVGYGYKGYLRNVKIVKNGVLVFNSSLQDNLYIGKDVISSLSPTTISQTTIINQLETQNWACFNGVNSLASIGTTSTLGWMNTGIFNLQFDIVLNVLTNAKEPFGTAGAATTTHGFFFYIFTSNSNLRVYWATGGGSYAAILSPPTMAAGVKYSITLKGDGTNLQYIIKLSDGSTFYDSGLVATTFVPFATTSAVPYFSNVYYCNCQMRNFKIFTDFAGTVPFMSLPMQNRETLMSDTVGGLLGNSTAVSIINNNTNVLRTKNLWLNADGVLGNSIVFGTTSTLSFVNSGTFNIQFDYTPVTFATGSIISTCVNNAQHGFYFRVDGTNKLNLNLANGSAYIAAFTGNVLTVGTPYHITLQGNGTQIRYIQTNLNTKSNVYDSGWTACTYTSFATMAYQLSINNVAGYAGSPCYLRNVKIFSDANGTVPFMNLPLNDNGNIGKDVVSGLIGTVANLKVVEI